MRLPYVYVTPPPLRIEVVLSELLSSVALIEQPTSGPSGWFEAGQDPSHGVPAAEHLAEVEHPEFRPSGSDTNRRDD